MKTFLIIIIIYLFAFKMQPIEKAVLIQDNNKSNIIITPDNLRCKSVLGFKGNKWMHWNKKELKLGKNYFDFVPFENMRVEVIIYKY